MQLAGPRSDARRRKPRGTARALLEYFGDAQSLALSGDEEHDVARGIDDRQRERHPFVRRQRRVTREDRAIGAKELRASWKERRDVSVIAHAEKHDVERHGAELDGIPLRGGGRLD